MLESRQIHQRVLNDWEGGVEEGMPLNWHFDELKAAGFTPEQAEVLVKTLLNAINAAKAHVEESAKKRNLKETELGSEQKTSWWC